MAALEGEWRVKKSGPNKGQRVFVTAAQLEKEAARAKARAKANRKK